MKAISIMGAAAIMAMVCACTGGNKTETEISNFEIDETIKTATQSYIANGVPDSLEEWSARVTLSASIQWPMKFGSSDIKVLQDTILARAFGAAAVSRGVDGAIRAFVADTDVFETGVSYSPVDSLSQPGLYQEVTARILDLNTRMVTYQVQIVSYAGGAHPNTIITPFSYDLQRGRILTSKELFVAGSEPKLLEAIRQSLAYELNTTPDKLDEAGIFASQLTTIGDPYINGDAMVFHYNPYEIAPYSMGMIDVNVWAPEIEECLTPVAKALMQ